MRRYIQRTSDDSDDPLSAEKRTIRFQKKPKNTINDDVFKLEKEERESTQKRQARKKATEKRARKKAEHKQKAEKLEKNITEAKKRTKRLSQRVSDKNNSVSAAKQTLSKKQKELKELLEQASISHTDDDSSLDMPGEVVQDIETPLEVLKNQFEMMTLDQKTMEDKITLDALENMESVIQKLSNQVNNALDYMKNTPLEIRDCETFRTIHEAMTSIDIPYGVELVLPKESYTLQYDNEKIKSVLRNIVSNAIEAMGESGTITIDLKSSTQFLAICISNTGPEIEEEYMEKIFEPVFSTKPNGNGLGLARCKEIIQRHGGEISVQNNPTTFEIKLKQCP